jgi:hypothetical protein
MAATVLIRRLTGAGPTATDITSINTRANAEDAHTTAGTSNSILVPAAGTNYSYWVSTRLEVTAITAGTVDNVKWYTDGANNFGTGVTCRVGTATGYTQATGTLGETGLLLNSTNFPTFTLGNANAFTYTTGSPLNVTGTTSTTGQFGDRVVYQIEVGTTAASGATATETFTWRYDDTSS